MTKKIFALLLSLMMVFTLAMPSFAVSEENQKLSDAQIEDAINTAIAALVDADEDATVVIDSALINDIKSGADTPKEVAKSVAGLVFVEKEAAEEISSNITDSFRYTVKVIEDGKTTVYCSVDFEQFPEIFDARVFLLSIEKIQNKCDEVASANGVDISSDDYSAMSYSHVAGELALHMILAKLTKDSASWNPIADAIYDRAGVADLNVDEDRIPSFFITTFGDFITAIMNFITMLF